jgi:outer membrane immunogenic protein
VGRVEDTITLVATPGFFAAGAASISSVSENKVGWTLGAGVEAPVGNKLSVKAEYLYVDLGSVTNSFTSAINPAGILAGPAGTAQTTTSVSSIRDHIFRVGLNYHLD